jgi:hypothetical protein
MNDDLVETVQHLANLLAQENDALKRLDFAAAVALAPAKEAALAELTKQPPIAAPPPPLIALGKRLGSLAAENQELLERAIAVQTSIVRIVARAGAPPPAVTRYGGQGRRPPSHRTGAMALSTRAEPFGTTMTRVSR